MDIVQAFIPLKPKLSNSVDRLYFHWEVIPIGKLWRISR